MFFMLTNIILDVSLGIVWWTTKNTFNLFYYLLVKIINTKKIEYNRNDKTDRIDRFEKKNDSFF